MTRIHAHVYDPRTPSIFGKSKAEDRAQAFWVDCNHHERCELYRRGQCAALRFLGTCIYTNELREDGPTKRSKGIGAWVAEKKATFAGVGTLAQPRPKMARVGDYVWLPYALTDSIRTGKQALIRDSRDEFVPCAEFTVDLIVKLCEAVPRTLFGEPIPSYQREEVPKLVAHLVEVFPEMVADVAARSQRVRDILATLTRVGRKARLATVRPGIGLLSSGAKEPGRWAWDGQTLTCVDRAGFPPFTPFNATRVTVTPGPDACVYITDDAQVDASTVFVD